MYSANHQLTAIPSPGQTSLFGMSESVNMVWESCMALRIRNRVVRKFFSYPESSKMVLGDAELLSESQTLHPTAEREPASSTSVTPRLTSMSILQNEWAHVHTHFNCICTFTFPTRYTQGEEQLQFFTLARQMCSALWTPRGWFWNPKHKWGSAKFSRFSENRETPSSY